MGGFVCLCKAVRKRLENFEKSGSIATCNCGWEIDTGYAIAYGLAILEAKRLCLLALGIFVEWDVLYFAGGLIPLVLTVVSVSFGVPASLGTVFAIHKRRRQPCFPGLKKLLRLLSGLVLFCAVFNVFVMASIAVYLNASPDAISRVFNTSMILYSEETWHKVTVDEFQFTFQCCGHTRFDDWMHFDWQRVDYASREEMSGQQTISDEDFRPLAVPFSCCNIHNMMPCFHMDLSMTKENTVNQAGCADVISHIVLRSAIFTYCVLTFLVLTQILLTIFIVKIIKRPLAPVCPSVCDCTEKCPSVCPLIESSTSYVSSNGGCTSTSERNSSRSKNRGGRLSTISSRSSSSPSPSPPTASSNSRKSTLRNSSARTRRPGGCGGLTTGAARIRPSLHTEHRVPKKRCCPKRAAGVRPN